MSTWESIAKHIRRFDAYPKTLEDFRVKTFAGAAVTVISGTVMIFLLISELNYYWSIEIHSDLYVDISKGHKIKIYVNVTFPFLPCGFMGLDAIDVSGQRQINIAHTLLKQRLNGDGTLVNTKAELVNSLGPTKSPENETITLDPNRCESCYGAEVKETECCNTCNDVKEAYRRRGWAFPDNGYTSIAQCKREKKNHTADFKIGEGCLIYGHLEVNKVAGNFHISPGNSYEIGHAHVHDLGAIGDRNKINVTHTINHLSFGKRYPGQIHPLDGLEVVALNPQSAFNYYLKIVPTTYVSLNGSKVKTNQFSVTRHERVAAGGSASNLPGMFVSYELSPMMVQYTEKSRSFSHFLTSVCAIIGGIFSVAGILDAFIYRGTAALKKKMELGKFT